jgi:hypothetical protein
MSKHILPHAPAMDVQFLRATMQALPDLNVDSLIKFKLIHAGSDDSKSISVSAKILRTFGQFTLSPVLRIELSPVDGVTKLMPPEAVLKL